ncbi:hypothetical protein Y695_00242 [Hydrogenophaga sp. T4]|nr:hypothetical protein Y695_00242 [Hydrogenophaga sp. T4]
MAKFSSRIIGRQDYTEPVPMSAAECSRVATVTVSQHPELKTWFEVFREGTLIGFVASRMYGLEWRTLDGQCWVPTRCPGSRRDPRFGRAILSLLDELDSNVTA